MKTLRSGRMLILLGFQLSAAMTSNIVLAQDSSVQTVAAYSKSLQTERLFDGVVEPVNSATVSAQTSGQITEVNYDVNDFVEKGSIIVRVREIQQSAQVARAEAEVRAAKARLLEAQKSFKRAEELYERNSISKAEFDSARAVLDASKAQVDAALAAVNQAQEALGYTVVRAPFDGIVTARHVEIGETVSSGQPLMTGFSLQKLRVRVDVPQSLIAPIRQLDTARVFSLVDRKQEHPVESITIFPYANAQTNSFTVRINLPDDTENLFPGMLTKVAFVTGEHSSLVIPESAVVHRSEVTGAYVVDTTGAIRLRQLRIGKQVENGLVEVLAGLRESERVAINPILAGMERIRQDDAASQAVK